MDKTSKETKVNAYKLSRRELLRASFLAGASAPVVLGLSNCALALPGNDHLAPPDENGIRLRAGLKSRVLARSGEEVPGSDYVWHDAPDGGACFSKPDGWAYVSNSEQLLGRGGAGALVFNASGEVVGAHSILKNTTRNCAGGAMPWGTWLSCEEDGNNGRVFECDPWGNKEAIERPLLGRFNHEAAVIDTATGYLYLTEDKSDGGLYRYVPDGVDVWGNPNLEKGQLQIAKIKRSGDIETLTWHDIKDPSAKSGPTRKQVAGAAEFKGGEGLCIYEAVVYFTTKKDNRVWAYDTKSHELMVIYDLEDSSTPFLSGVDNITVNAAGQLFVAEDGGDMQIVMLSREGVAQPILQVTGQSSSEICGPAFSPDGTRLYFSSQRGTTGFSAGGITYEVSGFSPA